MKQHDYEPHPGQSIEQAANALQARAIANNAEVTMAFNGIELSMGPDTSTQDVVAMYWQLTHKQAEAYRNSPEGKAAAEKQKANIAAQQQKIDNAMARLPMLDFNNLTAVFDWLTEIQDPSNHVGVETPRLEIIDAFADRGFYVNVNCGEYFDAENRENAARWLIGQALSNLILVGAIHSIFNTFAADWKMKFNA
jgi:hypothetical protein